VLLLVTDWLINRAFVDAHGPYVTFGGAKITALLVALFGPSAYLSVALIGLATLSPFAQVAIGGANLRARLPDGEPWLPLLVGFAAFAILVVERKHSALRREMARTLSDRAWLERVARLSWALRDFTRAPLETLREEAAVLRRDHPRSARTADRIEHAVSRI